MLYSISLTFTDIHFTLPSAKNIQRIANTFFWMRRIIILCCVGPIRKFSLEFGSFFFVAIIQENKDMFREHSVLLMINKSSTSGLPEGLPAGLPER